MWRDACADCHGPAGAFARDHLAVESGRLRGPHWPDLKRFLANHHAPAAEIDAIYAMLLAQAETPPRFQERCAVCHGSAAQLARESLEFRDEVLTGTGSGRPVAGFLPGHAGIAGADVTFFLQLLERVEREVSRK